VLAVIQAVESKAQLIHYMDFEKSCSALGQEGRLSSIMGAINTPEFTDFVAAMKAFKAQDEAEISWKNSPEKITPLFDAWLHVSANWVESVTRLISDMESRLSKFPERVEAINSALKVAMIRQADEYAASLVHKLDARTLKKMQKAAEREKARAEAETEAETGSKKAKKALNKMNKSDGGAEETGEGTGPISSTLAALMGKTSGVPKRSRVKGSVLQTGKQNSTTHLVHEFNPHPYTLERARTQPLDSQRVDTYPPHSLINNTRAKKKIQEKGLSQEHPAPRKALDEFGFLRTFE